MTGGHQRRARPGAWLAAVAFLAGVLMALPVPVVAQDRRPLLVEDTTSLHQRVLTRPGAVIRAAPSPDAEIVDDAVASFTVFYVFGRDGAGPAGWVEVGGPLNGPAAGWVRAREVIDWRQTMVVAFPVRRANRERVLFFDERDALGDLLSDEQLGPRAAALRAQAVEGTLPPDSPVIAIEPETPPDLSEQFYLLPILDAEEVYLDSGYDTRLLHVASIPLDADPADDPRSALTYEEALAAFEVGIVFVIDTTTSMGPFIERTQEAVRRVYERIGDSEIADRVSFSLIGFRDNVQLRPELEYVSEVFVPLESGQSTDVFLEAIARMTAADVSSAGFNEDAMAGLRDAIGLEGWDKFEFGGRYVILVTDAGPRRSNDPGGATGLAPAEINSLARENGIAVYTLHLLSEAGAFDHDYAAAAYRALSRFDGIDRPLYYPVADGDVDAFGEQVDALTELLIDHVSDTVSGRVIEVSEDAESARERQARMVGRAMQLAYLGRVTGARAPDVFEAWTADIDMSDPRLKSLDVRVLLTKNQLSDLTQVLETILEVGETAQLEPDEFFGRLRSAVAHLSRDPNLLPTAEFESLGGLIGEYLDGLPYRSQIMEIDARRWNAMGPGGQLETLDTIRSKLELYRRYDATPALWQALYDGAPPGEHVFPVPLDDLP